jgi:hypothetical protein
MMKGLLCLMDIRVGREALDISGNRVAARVELGVLHVEILAAFALVCQIY